MGTSFAFPSRWSNPACPSQSPLRRSLLSLPASHSHLSRPAPSRSVPCLACLSSRRSLSSQLFSARKSWRPLPAALTFPLDMVITSGIVRLLIFFCLVESKQNILNINYIRLLNWHHQNSKLKIHELVV